MRVAIFNGPGRPITIEQAAEPQPAPDEILVKVCRCGICGSDISMTGDAPFTYAAGRRFGHEYAGEVVEVGRGIEDVKVGDRVACLPGAPCGKCEGCRSGNPLFCTSVKVVVNGFGEYSAVPRNAAVLLPRSLSIADGALVEPMACGLHGLRLAQMRGGERVLILGAGAMALSVTYWARRLGAARIVVLSRSVHRRDVALAFGADAVETFDTDDPKAIQTVLGGRPDIVAECVGKNGMLAKAIAHVRPQGTVISLGMCLFGEPITAAQCSWKEARLVFPHGYLVDEFVETAKAFDSGSVRPDAMVSDVIALEELPTMMDSLRGGAKKLKVHVDPHLESRHA